MSKEDYGEMLHAYTKHRTEIFACKLEVMCAWLGFTCNAARVLVHENGLNSPVRLRVLNHKNLDYTCNVVRKPGGKSAHSSPKREY